MAKIPVGDTINYGYSFTFGNLLPLLGLTWIPLVVVAAINYYTQTLVFAWLAKLPMFMGGERPDPQAFVHSLSDMGGMAGLGFLAWLVTLFMDAVIGVAICSLALGLRSGTTYAHIAAGAPEWRVFGGYIRLFFALIGVVVIATLGIVVCVLIGKAISPDGGAGGFVGVVLGIAIFCLALLTVVRMSYLLVPSIVAEPGKGGIARSYHLTHGNFWRIFVVSLVFVLPVALVSGAVQNAILGSSMMGPIMEAMSHMQPGQQVTPTEQMQMFNRMFTEMMQAYRDNIIWLSILNFVTTFFIMGLTLSGASFAYRALSGGAAEATPAPAPTPA